MYSLEYFYRKSEEAYLETLNTTMEYKLITGMPLEGR